MPEAYNFIKRDSGTGVSCEFLQNFYQHLFYRTPPVAASKIFYIITHVFKENTEKMYTKV